MQAAEKHECFASGPPRNATGFPALGTFISEDDEIALHFIVETKSDNPRESDKTAVEAQCKFFEKADTKNMRWKRKIGMAMFEEDLKELAKQKSSHRSESIG